MSAIRSIRPITRTVLQYQSRTMSTSIRLNAEGSTGSGSSRVGGQVSGDAFTKREEANEAKYIKDHEMQKLRDLKAKVKEQKADLDKLEKHVEELSKGQK